MIQPPVPPDQRVCRAVVLEVGFVLALKFGDDAVGEDFAQFDAPLIERVDVPDRPLRENFMFVERDQSAQSARSQAFGHDRVRGLVALESAMRNLERRHAVFGDFFSRLAEGQRLRLCEEVRHQQIVMASERIERLDESDEVAGD